LCFNFWEWKLEGHGIEFGVGTFYMGTSWNDSLQDMIRGTGTWDEKRIPVRIQESRIFVSGDGYDTQTFAKHLFGHRQHIF